MISTKFILSCLPDFDLQELYKIILRANSKIELPWLHITDRTRERSDKRHFIMLWCPLCSSIQSDLVSHKTYLFNHRILHYYNGDDCFCCMNCRKGLNNHKLKKYGI